MGDLTEDYRFMREEKKKRHSKNFDINMDILLSADPPVNFRFKTTVCLFRDKGKPQVDFYPHTGRWKFNCKMYKGGAKKFLIWYGRDPHEK